LRAASNGKMVPMTIKIDRATRVLGLITAILQFLAAVIGWLNRHGGGLL